MSGDYPRPGYTNLQEVVDRTKIEEFNLTIGVGCAPKVHLMRERLLRKKGRVYSVLVGSLQGGGQGPDDALERQA